MTSIGDLKHRVTLQGVAVVIGDGGQKTRSYPDIANVWAEIRPSQLPIRSEADRLQFIASYQITIPYSEGYLQTRRITVGSRQYTVQSIINLNEDDRFLVFLCEEVLSNDPI